MHFALFSMTVSDDANRIICSVTFVGIPYFHLPKNVTRNEQITIRVVVDTENDGIVSFEVFLCDALQNMQGEKKLIDGIKYGKQTESTSHIRMLVSSEAEARKTPSGDHAISELPAVWPLKLRISTPVKGFQIFTTLSAPKFVEKCEATKQYRSTMRVTNHRTPILSRPD